MNCVWLRTGAHLAIVHPNLKTGKERIARRLLGSQMTVLDTPQSRYLPVDESPLGDDRLEIAADVPRTDVLSTCSNSLHR